jgi:hypothetical protein
VIKDEPATHIEIRPPSGGLGTLFCKRYRQPVWLIWRTFLRPSRGQREFRILRAANALGLPCVEAVSWDDRRVLGCVVTSEIRSGFVDGQSLEQALAATDRSPAARTGLCQRAGELLRELHLGGLVWLTAVPRNVIQPNHRPVRMLACDLPYAFVLPTPIHGTRLAEVDLFSLGFSASRMKQLSDVEQRELLLAYTAHDEAMFQRLWHTLLGRTEARQRRAQAFLRALSALPAALRLKTLQALGMFRLESTGSTNPTPT